MIRLIAVFVLTIVWCTQRQAPVLFPDLEAPVAGLSCLEPAPVPAPQNFDRALFLLAGSTQLTDDDLLAIAQDELAALRYLIAAVRTPGPAEQLPLGTTRPLLHALNALVAWPDVNSLPLPYLSHLHTHYDTQLTNALMLADAPEDLIHALHIAQGHRFYGNPLYGLPNMCERLDAALERDPAAVLGEVCRGWPTLVACPRHVETVEPLQQARRDKIGTLQCRSYAGLMVQAVEMYTDIELPMAERGPRPDAADAEFNPFPWQMRTIEFYILLKTGSRSSNRDSQQSCIPPPPEVMEAAPAWP